MAASPSVTEELTCSICLELFEEPVLLPCAHTFCRQCLREFCARHPVLRHDEEQGDSKVINILCPKCRANAKLGTIASFLPSSSHSLFTQLFVLTFIHFFFFLVVHLFIQPFLHSFIHSFIHSLD